MGDSFSLFFILNKLRSNGFKFQQEGLRITLEIRDNFPWMTANTGIDCLDTLLTFRNNLDKCLVRDDPGIAGLALGQGINLMIQLVSPHSAFL